VSSLRSNLPAVTPVLSTKTSTRTHVSSPVPSHGPSTPSSRIAPVTRNSTSLVLPSSQANVTFTGSRTSSQMPEFTSGAAAKVAGTGMAVLIGAVGLFL
jgi:hypothetical protein